MKETTKIILLSLLLALALSCAAQPTENALSENTDKNNYDIQDNILIKTRDGATYQWFDYIFNKKAKPKMLKDKINYQVMGANEWRSASSIEAMSNKSLKLYLTNEKTDQLYSLNAQKPRKKSYLSQEVDFANRNIWNNDYYPDPIIRKEINTSNGFIFPEKEPMLLNGSFSGKIKASINKKDMDIGITLYEAMPNGEYFNLSYFIGRASYAKDITKRKLLRPNKVETIPFSNTHLVSKKLSKGSRLIVALNINKNPFSQLNYGSGKDVSTETIDDAKEPLKIDWFNDSFVKIPVLVLNSK